MAGVLIKLIGIAIFSSVAMYFVNFRPSYRHINHESTVIKTDLLTTVGIVSDKFLSIALDAELIKNGKIHHINDIKFLQGASLLAPAYLRIGGTNADRLIFVENDTLDKNEFCENRHSYEWKDHDNFTMTENTWKSIINFSDKCGFQIIFDINVLLRKSDKWDSSNAQKLILYSSQFEHDIVWQLGNEPNSFKHVFGTTITPAQLAEDFKELRILLNKYTKYENSMIIGPDVTRPHNLGENPILYLKYFLSSIGNSTINAVTWHQYYLNGRNAVLEDFINPEIFNILKSQALAIKNIVRKQLSNVPIWLSETSSAYGGGAPGLSDTFVAGFLWLDKLGVAAKSGIDVVVRQSLYNGYYALLDKYTFDPLPDWWLSIMYKRLVGTTVLDIEQFVNSSGKLRLYAHCSAKEESIITLFGMNLKNSTSHFYVQSRAMPSAHISVYILTGCTGLTSRSVCLNGNHLILNPNGSLPLLKPIIQSIHSRILVPAYSLGFWTFHDIRTNICT